MISDETVQRVRETADIVQVISEYVPLKRAGADFRGPCPFHNGTKPNFSVSAKRGSYHCFVCNESGDVFTFVRKRLGLDWPAAVKMIGERFGVDVIDTPTRASAPDPNEKNWETLAAATEWFRAQLVEDPGAREAREYLSSRGLDEAARERFSLGYAPRDAQLLRRYLGGLGFDDERQMEAGLLVTRENDNEPRIRFRNRVMFPIVDELGHHVGFGGRALGDAEPKYLNSPESKVFQKRRTLYGMYTAKHAMRRAERAVVVEGYTDAISLTLAGVEEVVAPLGTALTDEQADLLTRYAKEVFLLYDSDDAGQRATFRSGRELLRHRAAVRVVSLPRSANNGKSDPDSFVRENGRAALEAPFAQAIDLFDRQVQLCERKGWFADLTKIRRAIDKLLPTIRATRDPLTRDLYLARLSEVTHLDKSTLVAEADEPAQSDVAARRRSDAVNDDAPPTNGEAPSSHEVAPSFPAPPRQWQGRRGARNSGPEWKSTLSLPRVGQDDLVERTLIRAMLTDRSLVERVGERHSAEEFRDVRYRGIFAALLGSLMDDDLEVIASRVPDVALPAFREIVNGADTNAAEAADVSMALAKFDARPIEQRIADIHRELGAASLDRQNALMRERMDLEAELRRLLPVRSPRTKPKG